MANFFGIPDNPIGDEAHASNARSRYSHHVIVSYPTVVDWRNLYDPRGLRNIRDSRHSFENMRQHHQLSVSKQLDLINSTKCGKALFSELSSAPHEVFIFPFDFLPSRLWGRLPQGIDQNSKVVALTTGDGLANVLRTFRQGLPLCGTTAGGQVRCFKTPGGGGRVAIFFEELRATGAESADDALLHELVHATREMRGLLHQFPMSGGYGNKEEFLANLIENIHRAEKGKPPMQYGGSPITNPNAFLDADITPSPRLVIGSLRTEQKTLFTALAQISVFFNPVRQVDIESKAYVAKVERK